jgi:nucleoside-diphosphate-sugar epimerase
MKVLVTGSEGFLGSYLIPLLEKKGWTVERFDMALGQNILNREQITQSLDGCYAVIHLAAALDESLGYQKLQQINVEGTRLLLEEAVKQKIHHFVFLSSVGVMGNIKTKATEQTSFNPQTNYEKTKTAAEKLVQEFSHFLPTTIIRSALVYGPNKYWTSIIKLVKKNFPIIGSGENKMQLIYIKDMAAAIAFLLNKKQAEGQTYLIAEEKASTLNQVYATIANQLGTTKKPRHVPVFLAKIVAWFNRLIGKKTLLRPEYVVRLIRTRWYNTSKIKKLGWQPKYSLEKGFQETLKQLEL